MPKPLIKNFRVSPHQVQKGELFQIQWTTEGADKIEVFRNGNQLTTVLSNVESMERKEFYDSEEDVVYHLVAYGEGGSVKSEPVRVSLASRKVGNKKSKWIVWAAAGAALVLIAWLVSAKLFAPRKAAPVEASAEPAVEPVRIVLLGQTGHGKSTLAAAITKRLEQKSLMKAASYENISNARPVDFQGVRIQASLIEWTELKPFQLIDFKDETECKRFMKRLPVKLDGAIVVIAATDGPMPQTRQQLEMAFDKGIRSLIVFINKTDAMNDPELLQLVQMEIAELITFVGFDLAQVSIIKGSALMALNGADNIMGLPAIETLLLKLKTMYK
ncbi:MAG TPA: GTP-binding protein [Chitinophagaceae bacterium]